ncbi:MAG: hypothetical protein HWN80_09200 [Candidatus Lokiarchaeota archaeon]|nr:hypothetical protein [Candidatus Lokiarchaeota archaeon]
MTLLTTEKELEASGNNLVQKPITELKYKKKSLWKVIAKNEIRIRTSSFRNHRKSFFIILYALLFLWAFVIAPFIFDMFMPTLAAQYSTIFKPVIAILIESFLMTFFLILVMYPLNNVYREMEVGFKESLLATPVKPNDIFLGEFLGKAPIYTMAVLILAPIIVGMINPLIDLTIVQYIVIYACVFGVVYFANLVGSILASWFEHKISKSEKARDLGKALILVFTIAMIVIMYAVMFFLNELLANPELKNWLAFYPSLWFSNIILYSIDPVLLDTFVLNIWINLLLAVSVPLVILYISYKKAMSFYTLEGGIEKSSTTIIEHESSFYKIVRKATGRKWAGLVVMQLKRFLRKKANYARIVYVVGLLGFMTWFIAANTSDIFGISFGTTILIAIGGGIGSMMLGHLGFVDSKDLIWVYKRSPRGIKGLVYSYLLTMFILNIFIAASISIIFNIVANLDIVNTIIFFIEFLIFSQITMCQAMGIECISPAYGEKDSNMKSNAMISMLLLQPLIFLPIMMLIFIDIDSWTIKMLISHGVLFLYNFAASIPLLIFGMKKLNKIE